MSLLPLLPIKTLMPVPDDNDDDHIVKYEYFIQFDPMAYYRPYHEALKLLMPYWHNKSNYSHEEVSDLLKQVYNHLAPSIVQLENKNLIDSRVGVSIRHWLTLIHDNLPRRFRHADWHNTIARSAPEVHPSHVLHQSSPNAPLPGEERFDMDEPPTILESYLLHIIANNTDFPGHVFDQFSTPLTDTEEEEEVIVFSDPSAKKEPPTTPARPLVSSSTSAPLIPPRSTCPQRMPMSLVPPVVPSPGASPSLWNHPHVHALATILSQPNSPPSPLANRQALPLWNLFAPVRPLGLFHHPLMGATPNPSPTCPPPVTPDQVISHGFREMAGAFQDLRQALLSPGASALVSGSGAAISATPDLTSIITSLAPDELSPPALEPSKASSQHGNQGKPKGKKGKDKGKNKVIVPVPEPVHTPTPLIIPQTSAVHEEPPLPKKNLKRKCPAMQAATSEAGPSTQATSLCPTHACSATAKVAHIPEIQTDTDSERAGPSVKKPCFSPEKVAKRKSSQPIVTAAPKPAPHDSNRMFHGRPKQQFLAAELTQAQDPNIVGIPINRHNSRVELENYHFEDLITAPVRPCLTYDQIKMLRNTRAVSHLDNHSCMASLTQCLC
ncbi:hypothetical protein ARMSODRAFT_1020799 [Armillaria solidipes]|uniref:Uncharacterized protein n=1 Tax=Armillaria solidipes TaxID=1076256 RepID=A0A2H3BMS1_9AGAR|nr:hypothetical protein ARMSODRAFT_1020799 [Armillaria solidipes]